MRNIIVIFALFFGAIIYSGCTKCGCTDPDAINYDKSVQEDDGSCVYPNSKIVGKYICTRKSELENTTDNIVLEIFPVRTSKKLLRAWDSSLDQTFLMTYDNNGNLRDTALAQGLPGYTQLLPGQYDDFKSFATSAYGTYDKLKSILLNYNCHKCTSYLRYTPEHYVYSGIKIQDYSTTFDTPDYREIWTGIYEGTKRSVFYVPDTSYVTTRDVTLEVSLTDNDSVVRIEEITDNPEAMFYYAKPDGTLKNIRINVGSFSNDSLIFQTGKTYSPGASTSISYKCKKR